MIRGVLLALLLIPSLAAAQTVAVRSGEHPTFTRLVMALPEGSDWTLGRMGDGYGLVVDPVPDGFDLSDVFTRVPRDRLGDLRFEVGRLVFDIACDCRATAFGWQADSVVIDITDGPPAAGSEFEVPLDAPMAARRPALPQGAERTVLQPVPLDIESVRIVGVTVGEPAARPAPAVDEAPAPQVTETAARPTAPPDRPFTNTVPTSDPSRPALSVPSALDDALEAAPRVAALEAALLEGLGRAASQGLLSPSADFPTAEPATEEVAPPPPPPASQAPVRPGIPGITARTSIERDRPHRETAATNSEGGTCLDEGLFDVSTWADERPFFEQLTERRFAITTETGEFVEEETMRLARFYVHFGFGREALAALEQTTHSSPDSDVLAVMARIVDGLPQRGPLLAGQEDCPSDVALWSVLAAGDQMTGAMAEPDSVIQTLRRLPDPLRGHLGQRLADIFADLGDVRTAEALLIVSRDGMTADATERSVVEASIADRTGDTGRAIASLTDLAEADARMTPDALVELVMLSIKQGEAVPEQVLALSEVMRFENARNPEVVAKLLDAEIRALLGKGAHDRAIEMVAEADRLPEEQRLEFNSSAVAGIVREAGDDAFLTFAFGPVPTVDAETENGLARRLVDLGFEDRAAAVLRAEPRQEAAGERRYLRAEIALRQNLPEEVETILAGMTDERALAIRVEALSALGRHDEALALSGLGAGAEDTILAWRAEAWPLLSSGEGGPLRDIAAIRAGSADAGDAPQTAAGDVPAQLAPLAERRALLQETGASRQAILDLLGQFQVEMEPDGNATN